MADIKSPEERSKNMSAIKNKNTRPEVYLRKLLFSRGYRYRICSGNIPGHPDLWLRKYNVAIFVNGCFWHRHQDCRFAYTPKSRIEFWEKKFEANTNRDNIVRHQLEEQGYRYLIVWECAINQSRKKAWSSDSLIEAVSSFIQSDEQHGEISVQQILPSVQKGG